MDKVRSLTATRLEQVLTELAGLLKAMDQEVEAAYESGYRAGRQEALNPQPQLRPIPRTDPRLR